jgi:hypothetical protein
METIIGFKVTINNYPLRKEIWKGSGTPRRLTATGLLAHKGGKMNAVNLAFFRQFRSPDLPTN